MGHYMIAGGGSSLPSCWWVGDGLGILPDVIVDQHFQNRNRMARNQCDRWLIQIG